MVARIDWQSTWRCSVCRRKLASRGQPIVTQESTDSLLEVPVLEALQRRHSDAKLGCQAGGPFLGGLGGLGSGLVGSGLVGSGPGAIGSGLAPPRSPELRRHSDVSPASLKELEKVISLSIHIVYSNSPYFEPPLQKRETRSADFGNSTR